MSSHTTNRQTHTLRVFRTLVRGTYEPEPDIPARNGPRRTEHPPGCRVGKVH